MEEKDPLLDKLYGILKSHFPDETVDVSRSGIRDNVHVIVVSKKFDPYRERQKQEYLWDLIDHTDLTEEEKARISMILPLSVRELR